MFSRCPGAGGCLQHTSTGATNAARVPNRTALLPTNLETFRGARAQYSVSSAPGKLSWRLRSRVTPIADRTVGDRTCARIRLAAVVRWHEVPQFSPSFKHDLYLSSRALVTLNDGDPENGASQFLSVCEGGLGLAFLGLVVGYLRVLYVSFREACVRQPDR
jgi:hypothetical protein